MTVIFIVKTAMFSYAKEQIYSIIISVRKGVD